MCIRVLFVPVLGNGFGQKVNSVALQEARGSILAHRLGVGTIYVVPINSTSAEGSLDDLHGIYALQVGQQVGVWSVL